MRIVTTDLLHSFLMVLNRLPGKQALLLVPLALGYSKLDPTFCSSKADAKASPAYPPAAAKVESTGVSAAAGATDSTLPGPLGILATQLMGQNQFASVSTLQWLIAPGTVHLADVNPGFPESSAVLHGSKVVGVVSLTNLRLHTNLASRALFCHPCMQPSCCYHIAGWPGADGCGCCCCWRQASVGVSAALLPAPCDGHSRDRQQG
jgi:hypothetical protein